MSIKDFKLVDHPEVLHIMGRFAEEAKQPFDYVHFIDTWGPLEENGMAQMFGFFIEEKMVGALGCFLTPDPLSGELTAFESFWYVLPEHRGGVGALKLVKRYIAWSEEQGADRVSLVHLSYLNEEKLPKFYKRLGFEPLETHYLKRFN